LTFPGISGNGRAIGKFDVYVLFVNRNFVSDDFHNGAFFKTDLINLPKYSMYLKMMIDGATSQPFSANSLPLPECHKSFKSEVIATSREAYSKPRKGIEREIFERHKINKETKSQTLF